MDRDRFQQAMTIFERALSYPTAKRRAFVRETCGEDEDLRQQVESLLQQLEAEDGFLESGGPGEELRLKVNSLLDASGSAPPLDPPPERIRDYRILGCLGRGGMGTVYEAERKADSLRVALKLLHGSVPTDEIRARFERESEILRRLHHPGIARLLEAGVTDGGTGGRSVPYFVMELVRGRPLTRYASEEQLEVRSRVEIVARICDAVDHANSQGVVHRDLKPDNILVTDEGAPKVLDFGVARVTDRASLESLGTVTGLLMGTLAYMSPEQAGGNAGEVDRRADVYALGVILFQLLAKRLPFELADESIPGAVRRIREEVPPHLGSLDPSLRGHLESMVAKAVSKNRDDRYASAAALAADIRACLAGKAISIPDV